jgi:hypothetical protein
MMDYRVQLQHVPEQTVGRCSSRCTSTSTTTSRVFRVARRHGSQDAIAIQWFRDDGTTGTTDRHHGYGREIATGTRPRSDGIQKKKKQHPTEPTFGCLETHQVPTGGRSVSTACVCVSVSLTVYEGLGNEVRRE